MLALQRLRIIRMWVRKRIEISLRDLAAGLGYCLSKSERQVAGQQVADLWQADDAVVCLSVRSGFDLFLQSVDWEAGSEIIMSGLTIPDMPRIVEQSGYTPVGVDIHLDSMCPRLDEIERAINSKTKAIVVAHLLGGVCDLTRLLELAKQHNLIVIEDCAQAFVGNHYQGDSRADLSMFSFGPIKTNTALAGGVFRVRNQSLRQAMLELQKDWNVQSRWTFAKRIAKYAFVKGISTRLMCGGFYRIMKLFGKNHDGVASTMARGFAGPRFFERIRQQPSVPLLKLLFRKLDKYDPKTTERRRDLGQHFNELVGDSIYVLGSQMQRQTYWVLPLLVDEPDRLVQQLWDAGFDASNACSLHSIVDDEDSTAANILRHIVFLPLHYSMPKREIERLASVVKDADPNIPMLVERETGHGNQASSTTALTKGRFESSLLTEGVG